MAKDDDETVKSILEWVDALERAIKEECDERFLFGAKVDKEGSVSVEYAETTIAYRADKDMPCAVEVIKKNLPLMPPKVQEFFKALM